MAIINETQIDNLDNQDLSVVPTKTLIRKFGKAEDNVEILVYDLNGALLLYQENFRGFRPPEQVNDKDGLYNEINIDYTQTLKDLGFTSGKYNLIIGFYRKMILNSFIKPFYISEISPSRREIKIKSDFLSDENVINGFNQLIGVLESSAYFREFILNFGDNNQATGINFQIDSISEPTEVLIKLYDPLPNNLGVKSKFRIAEEIINPVSLTIDLGEPTLDELIVGEDIKGPNLRIDTRLNSSKPSTFRTYDQILGNSVSSSLSNIDNYLSSSLELAIDFTDTDTETGFHFENFIHFSSAVERLKNFRYKLQLLESYESDLNDITTLEGAQTASVVVIAEENRIEKKKNNLISTFDPYERFLYYESGTYAWPKTTSVRPFQLASVNSNEAKNWIGSEDYNSGYYGGQLLSASAYDEVNIHRLTDTLPEHVVSNHDNEQYVLFVNMVGEHFDKIWLYMDHITNLNEADSKLRRGVSKELVYDMLERAGVKVFDQFENENLFSYIAADGGRDGVFQYQAPPGQTMVSASSAGSIPKGDITKEVWKRIYHNLPYLLKTKGTERGMKALISCYGIPESILHVKEFGGSTADRTTFRTFTYPKKSKWYSNPTDTDVINYLVDINKAKTTQIRILPDESDTNSIFLTFKDNLSQINANDVIHLAISQSTDLSVNAYEKQAYLLISHSQGNTSSSLGPLLNGDPWNISVNLDNSSNEITAYATQTNVSKNTFVISCSAVVNEFFDEINPSVRVRVGQGFSGSIQEFRIWDEYLTKDTIVTQSLSPFNYNGNSISSSFENLIVRAPLGSDWGDWEVDSAIYVNYVPNHAYRDIQAYQVEILPGLTGSIVQEIHHLPTPDTVGKSMVSEKVRLDTGTIDDDILSPFIRSEESTQDRQPNDFSDLGVYFSPTFEVNEDIIYTLGGFRMDDYIGDPRHYTSDVYPDLESLRKIYTQKVDDKIINIWDYLKLIQQFDHTLFKMIEQFAPAKANLKTGLVIEPHYLNREKLQGLHIETDSTTYDLDLNRVDPPLSSEYILNELNIDVYDYIVTGSGGDLENNAVNSRLSNVYYTRVKGYSDNQEPNIPLEKPNVESEGPSGFEPG